MVLDLPIIKKCPINLSHFVQNIYNHNLFAVCLPHSSDDELNDDIVYYHGTLAYRKFELEYRNIYHYKGSQITELLTKEQEFFPVSTGGYQFAS